MDRNLNFVILKEMKLQLFSFNVSRLDDTWDEQYHAMSLNQLFDDILITYDKKQSVKICKFFLLRSQKTLIFTSLLQLLTLITNFSLGPTSRSSIIFLYKDVRRYGLKV